MFVNPRKLDTQALRDFDHSRAQGMWDRDDLLPQSLSCDAQHNPPIHAIRPQCDDVDSERS